MKILLTSIILLHFSFFFQELDLQKMKTDAIVIKLKKLNKEILDGHISGRYKVPKNYAEIRKNFGASPSKEELSRALKDAGMNNAEEYVKNVFTQTALMSELFKKYPAIEKLNPTERSKFLQGLLMEVKNQ